MQEVTQLSSGRTEAHHRVLRLFLFLIPVVPGSLLTGPNSGRKRMEFALSAVLELLTWRLRRPFPTEITNQLTKKVGSFLTFKGAEGIGAEV